MSNSYDEAFDAGWAAAREDAADGRVTWDRYKEIQGYDPGEAAELLASGQVRLEDHPMGRAVLRNLEANRIEKERLPSQGKVVSREEYERSVAAFHRGEAGWAP